MRQPKQQIYAGDIIKTGNKRVWWLEDHSAAYLQGRLLINPEPNYQDCSDTNLFTVSLRPGYFTRLGWCADLDAVRAAASLGGEDALIALAIFRLTGEVTPIDPS